MLNFKPAFPVEPALRNKRPATKRKDGATGAQQAGALPPAPGWPLWRSPGSSQGRAARRHTWAFESGTQGGYGSHADPTEPPGTLPPTHEEPREVGQAEGGRRGRGDLPSLRLPPLRTGLFPRALTLGLSLQEISLMYVHISPWNGELKQQQVLLCPHGTENQSFRIP